MPTATPTCNTLANVSAFSFEGADVRVFNRSNEPWWVLSDVCAVLDISKHRDAAQRLDNDERGAALVDTLGGPQETTIINESGLYSLILTSRKPAAKRFKKWVTSEVLPSIRKTGAYNPAAPKPRRPSVLRTFRTAIEIGKLAGFEANQLALHAGRYCKAKCGENPLELMEIKALPSKLNEYTLSPREIGVQLGGLSAQKINEALTASGLQTYTKDAKGNRVYHLTDAGRAYGRLEETSRAYTDGGITVLRWYPTVKERVRQQMGLTPVPQLETSLALQGGHV